MGVHARWLVRRYLTFVALIAVAGTLVHSTLDLANWTRRVAGSSSSAGELARGVITALPDRLGLFLPLAMVLGLLAAVGGAAARGEVRAQAAVGVSPRRTVAGVLAAAAALGLLALLNQAWLAPASRWLAVTTLWRADRRAGQELVRVGPDGWRWCFGSWDPATSLGRDVLLLGGPPDRQLLVQARLVSHGPTGWSLERGHVLDLERGRVVDFHRWSAGGWVGGEGLPTVAAPTAPPEALCRRGRAPSELGLGALLAARDAAHEAVRPALGAELWGRLALGLVPVALVAAALPVALGVDRRRWPRAVAAAVALCWLTYALLGATRAAALAGVPLAPLLLAGVAGGWGLARSHAPPRRY